MIRPHVLVVEDDRNVRELYLLFLRAAGYVVSSATDGAEALSLLSLHPDLLILDLRMPGLDGYGFLREMRARRSAEQPKVLVVSALPDRDALNELGPLRIVSKPFDAAQLLDEVGALVGSPGGDSF